MVRFICSILIVALLFACGGGGGGGDGSGSSGEAAFVNLDADTRDVEDGQRMTISIEIADVIEQGIILKIRHPEALQYVQNSSVLKVGDNSTDFGPTENVAEDTGDDGDGGGGDDGGGDGTTTPSPSPTATATTAMTPGSSVSYDRRYLVYFISPSDLDEDGKGTLEFKLEGVDVLPDGVIEVDADADNPNVTNSREFNVSDPEFSPEDEISVSVEDD